MGVRPLHSIGEVAEGNEAMEKRGRQEVITMEQAKGQTQRWQPLLPTLRRVNEAARPWLRFHTPLIEPDWRIYRVAQPLLAFAPTEPAVGRYRSGLFRKDRRRRDEPVRHRPDSVQKVLQKGLSATIHNLTHATTARRKGRQQICSTYSHRATPRLYTFPTRGLRTERRIIGLERTYKVREPGD
jgi:hypothetical protein